MPVYAIESPHTGQTWKVDFQGEGTPGVEDIEAAAKHFDTQWFDQQGTPPEVRDQGQAASFGNAAFGALGRAATGTVSGLAKMQDTLASSPVVAALGPMLAPLGMASKFTQQVLGMEKSPLEAVAAGADAVTEESKRVYPVNPANPVASTIGEGVGQGAAMLGTSGATALAGGSRAAMALAPQVMGFAQGAGAGIDTAREIGVNSPEGQAALGMLFGGVEMLTEKLGGIGGKQATNALMDSFRAPAKQLLLDAVKAVGSEAIEEPIAGVAQDVLTRAFANEDPANPGFTKGGVELPQVDPTQAAFWKKRGMEALGGASGGVVFAGAQLGANAAKPVSSDPSQPERPEGRTTNAAGAGASSSISPLPGIAQRAGTMDVPPLVPGLEAEDLGPLTAADVAEFEPVPTRQPILQNVPDAVLPATPSELLTSEGPNVPPVAASAIDELSQVPMQALQQQPPTGGQSAQPGSASVTPAGSSPAAAANADLPQAVPAGRKPLYEVRAAQGEQITDDQDADTGWRMNVFQDGVELVSSDAAEIKVFPIQDRRSGSEPIRARMKALSWAADNPRQRASSAAAPMQATYGDGRVMDINPAGTTATAAATPPPAAPAAMPVPARGEGGAGDGALLDVAPSQRPRNRGETTASQRPDVLAELGQATRAGEANQAQGALGFQNFTVDGTTAGFANAQILNEALDLVQQGFTTFANWSKAMVTRFGRGIREYLAAIWQQITSPQTNAARNVRLGMPQGNAPVTVGAGGFIPNPLHKQGEAFRVKAQIGRALLTGSPLPKDFTKVLDATDNERRAVDQTAAIVGRDLEAAVNAHAKRTGKPLADVWAMVEPVMTGQPGALTVLRLLDANLGERARRARNLLDDLSAAVARTMPAGEMRNTILGNLGQWMRRGYAAFDTESGWSFDKVTAAAKAGKMIAGKDAALILANARAYLQGQNPGATAAEIEADMRDLMDRDTWQSALLGGTVKKAVGSLMRRKDIAPEIRALMGEETNPLHRYLQSAKFQAQLVARHHGQVAMRTIGLATGLLKAARGGVYTVEIPKEGYLWSGLGGTFTTPELMKALDNSSGILQDGNSWGGWLVKTLKALGNEAKLNRVALNPDSWLVNVLGGFVSLVQSGDIYATSIVRRLREAGGTLGSTRKATMANALQDAQRALLARLTEQGVIGSSITLADIEASMPRHLLQWVAENETRDRTLGAAQGALIGQGMGRGLGLPGRAAGAAIGAVGGALAGTQNLQKWRQKVAEWTMTKPDNLFRVTGWLTNYETALAAGMQPDAAAKWASERTLNTFPNYNALPAVLREFSRLGLVGSFIAFQHEVYRNTYWNIRYAVREVGSGNAALQARGLQRLAGLTSIAAMTFGGGLAALLGMSGAAGADDERNKLFRKWFAAPWERDAVLAFDKFTPESVSYLNTSYLLPQVTIQELAQAASEGAPEGEAVERVMARLWEQFAASSVHLSPIINAALNVDRNGRRITNRPGVAGVLERADSAVATIGEPGFVEKMTRLAYALREAERRGRKFSVEQEVKRLFGLRGYERTWDTLVKGRYSRFGSEYQAIREDANRVLGENLPGAQVKAIEEANARIADLEAQRLQFEADMGRLGIAPGIVRAAKKDSAFNALNAVRVRADGKRVEAVTRR